MIPILFPADATTYGTNGLGRLAECIRCEVTEERNGIYELELELPITARHYAEIEEGMIVSVIHDDTKTRQPFIIYRRTAPINGIVTFYAHHVSYLLSGIILRPYTAATCAEALALMPTYSMTTNPFTFWTDKQTTASFKVEVPTGCRQQLAGIRGSVLDTFGGGEYEFDNFTVKLYQNRGTDSGVQIRYGKNLLDVEKEVDVSGIAGGVVGWWKGGEVGSETVIFTPVIYASGYGSGAPVLSLDLSGEFTEAPSVSDLTAKVNQYIADQKPQEPTINVKVDFVALWQTPEYKDIAPLERVRLCDTVHVIYDDLGVNVESKVIKIKYNVLTERYEEIELGQPKTNFTEMISAKTEDLINAVPTRSMIQAAVDHATDLITGGLGGHVVMNLNSDGEPQEILIMDTDDISTAVNVIRINQAGIGFSTTGYNGPFRSAWTIDGHFVADFIDTGSLTASLITAGTMLADRILGGTLKLGGALNGNGRLEIYDANDNLIGTLDNTGADLTGQIQMSNGYIRSRVGQYRVFVWVDSFSGVGWRTLNAADITVLDSSGRATSRQSILEYNDYLQQTFATNKTGIKRVFRKSTDPNLDESTSSGEYPYLEETIVGADYEGKVYDGTSWGFFAWGEHYLSYSDDVISPVYRTTVPGSTNLSRVKFIVNSAGIFIQYGAEKYLRLTDTLRQINGSTIALESTSSRRYKQGISDLVDKAIDPHRLLDLRVRQFRYKDSARLQYQDMGGQLLPGLIAEEVAEIYPAAVIRDADGKIESWDERRIIPGMLALIQEQEKKIAEQEDRLRKLEATLESLKEMVDQMR